jgi:hypothetical protein
MKNDPMARMNYIMSTILILLFIASIVKRYSQKKKCKHCTKNNDVAWLGHDKIKPFKSEKVGGITGLISKTVQAVFVNGNGHIFPVEKCAEICASCYHARRKKMIEELGYEKVMELKQNLTRKHDEIDYDPKFAWTHHPNGVRFKAREWDEQPLAL